MELNILEAKHRCNPQLPVILVGNLNTNMDNMDNEWSITIATSALQLGTTDVFHKFMQKNCQCYTCHKIMWDGTHQCTQCDYALVDADVPMKSLCLLIPLHFHSNHWVIKLQIHSSGARLHHHYILYQTQLLCIPVLPDEGWPNMMFAKLLHFHSCQ